MAPEQNPCLFLEVTRDRFHSRTPAGQGVLGYIQETHGPSSCAVGHRDRAKQKKTKTPWRPVQHPWPRNSETFARKNFRAQQTAGCDKEGTPTQPNGALIRPERSPEPLDESHLKGAPCPAPQSPECLRLRPPSVHLHSL